MALQRLDRANYGGTLTRSLLYQALRRPKADWLSHTVQPNEEHDLYRVAYNVYGVADVWWVVAVCARLNNPMRKIPAGTELRLPPLSWLREKLRDPGKTIVEDE